MSVKPTTSQQLNALIKEADSIAPSKVGDLIIKVANFFKNSGKPNNNQSITRGLLVGKLMTLIKMKNHLA